MSHTENNFDDVVTLDAAAAIGEHLFAYRSADTAIVATAGGTMDGVTSSEVTAVGDPVGLFTEGICLVQVGTAGVTADHDVMVATGGKAVDATTGYLAVGRALETKATGTEARVLLYDRPHHAYGSGTGAEKVGVLALAGATIHAAAGGVVAWQNPEGARIIITREILDVTTVSTGACTLDSGVTATSAATSSDTLLDGIDVNSATGVFDSMNAALDSGANAKAQALASGGWVTVDEKTGDATGLVGNLYIFYIVP